MPRGKPPQSKPPKQQKQQQKPSQNVKSNKGAKYKTGAHSPEEKRTEEQPLVLRKKSFLASETSKEKRGGLKSTSHMPPITSTPRDDAVLNGSEDEMIRAVAEQNDPNVINVEPPKVERITVTVHTKREHIKLNRTQQKYNYEDEMPKQEEVVVETVMEKQQKVYSLKNDNAVDELDFAKDHKDSDRSDEAEVIARLEGKGAIVVSENDVQEPGLSEEEEDEDEDEFYPVICRRCYVNFSTRMSPVCKHRFCNDCFQKCQTLVVVSTNPHQPEKMEFHCFTCATVASAQPKVKAFPVFEHCNKGVEKVSSFSSYAFLDPKKLVIGMYEDKESMYVIDPGCGKVLYLNADGELQQFSFLKNYRFQGGVSVLCDHLLLGLQNDKYCSISFYSLTGAFQFSAFLDTSSEITQIVSNSRGEIIALDVNGNNVDIINREKRVRKQKTLRDEEVQHPSLMAIHPHNDTLYIYDGHIQVVSVFDSNFMFLYKFSLCKSSSSNGLGKKGSIGGAQISDLNDKTLKLIIDKDGVMIRVQKTRISAYSINGEFILDIVVLLPNTGATGVRSAKASIRDAALSETAGTIAVLMVGGESTGEIRVYTYTVPSKYKTSTRLGRIREQFTRSTSKLVSSSSETMNSNQSVKLCTIL